MKKIFLIIIILIVFIYQKAEASSFVVKSSSNIVGLGEQFYVDVSLDTEGDFVNGVSGNLSFDKDKLNFVNVLDGKSMVDFWVEKPNIKDSNIYFSGIMSDNFSGVIDPFNTKDKLPGLIVRIVFEAKKPGISQFYFNESFVTIGDGLGTIKTIKSNNLNVEIQNIVNVYTYENKEFSSPTIEAYITKDKNIFNNKYVLIFKANDDVSGIKEVLIKEGLRSWKKIESPYLLEDQSRRSIIALQAVNYNGVSVITSFEPLPYKWVSVSNILLLLLILVFILIIFRKKYETKDKKN